MQICQDLAEPVWEESQWKGFEPRVDARAWGLANMPWPTYYRWLWFRTITLRQKVFWVSHDRTERSKRGKSGNKTSGSTKNKSLHFEMRLLCKCLVCGQMNPICSSLRFISPVATTSAWHLRWSSLSAFGSWLPLSTWHQSCPILSPRDSSHLLNLHSLQ